MTLPSLSLPSLNWHWMPCSQQMVGAFWSSGRATHLTARHWPGKRFVAGLHAFFQALHARFLSGHGSAAEFAFDCDTDLPLCCLCSTRTEALQSLQSTFLQARERAQVHVNSQMPDARAKPLHSWAPAATGLFWEPEPGEQQQMPLSRRFTAYLQCSTPARGHQCGTPRSARSTF